MKPKRSLVLAILFLLCFSSAVFADPRSKPPQVVSWREAGGDFIEAVVGSGGGEALIALGLIQAAIRQKGWELHALKIEISNPYPYQIHVKPGHLRVGGTDGSTYEIGKFLVKEESGKWAIWPSVNMGVNGPNFEAYVIYGAPKGVTCSRIYRQEFAE